MVMAKTAGAESAGGLVRAIDWRGAFWIASGVPALVLFSIGGIAGAAPLHRADQPDQRQGEGQPVGYRLPEVGDGRGGSGDL